MTVNGKAIESAATTLAGLCLELGYGEAKIATALNGEFVPGQQRDNTPIKERDTIEIVAPMQGG